MLEIAEPPTQRPIEEYPRKTPAGAPAETQIKTAQVNEGVAFLWKSKVRFEIGALRAADFTQVVQAIEMTYRAAADLEPTAEGRAAMYQNRILAMKVVETMTEARTTSEDGLDRPDLSFIRLHRLQAEADYLKIQGGK